MHPLMQVLAALLSLAVLGALLFFGLVFAVFFAGLALVLGLGLWARIRWLQWRARRHGQVHRMGPEETNSDAIDGEFIVIQHTRRERREPRD